MENKDNLDNLEICNQYMFLLYKVLKHVIIKIHSHLL